MLNFLTRWPNVHTEIAWIFMYFSSSYRADSLQIYQLNQIIFKPDWSDLCMHAFACVCLKWTALINCIKPLNLAFGMYLYPNALVFFIFFCHLCSLSLYLSLFLIHSHYLFFLISFMYIADILYVYILFLLFINNMFGHVFNAFKPKCTSLTLDKHVFNYF